MLEEVKVWIRAIKTQGISVKRHTPQVRTFINACFTLARYHVAILNAIVNRTGSEKFRNARITKTHINMLACLFEPGLISLSLFTKDAGNAKIQHDDP